jgi:putative membrane protein (TIGR04086 family)
MKPNLSSLILAGLLLMLIIVFVGALATTLLFQFTNISERQMPIFTYTVNAISLIVGGFIAGRKAGERGWFYGGLTGIFYGIILLLIAFLAFDLSFSLKSLASLVSCFAISAIGGIFGVNAAR